MRFTSTLSTAAALAVASASDLALYWGQASGGNQQSLGDYCKNSPGDIYLISFLDSFGSGRELSMEVNGYWNNLPGTQLPDAAATLGADIKLCQSLGKKVLVSMGGASGNYGFNSDADAQKVAEDLWNIFGGGQSSTRPFGDAKIDGFDLDGENNINAPEYTAFVNKLRALYANDPSKQYYVSAAPQCPFPDATVGPAIAQSQFDFLFVQFYNNYCTPLGSNFNWNTWQSFATEQSPNRNVKLFLGLPGAPSAAGSGYATPEQVKKTVDQIKSTPNFGGIMLWDAAQANNNHVDGTTFAQQMQNILDGSAPAPASSSTSSSSTAPAWTQAPSTSSTPVWAPSSSSSEPASEAPASSSSAPAWAPESSSSAANVAPTSSPVIPTSEGNGAAPVTVTSPAVEGNVAVTKYETFTTTSSCSTLPNGVVITYTSAVENSAPSSTSEVVSYPTSTATKVTASVGANGEDVWVTLHETFYTTECPSTAAGAATTTVTSTSAVQTTVPGVTTTLTSWPATRTTSVDQHDFTSNGEVYVYDTVWTTAYTTVWVR